jgi:hypothetical protein
MRKTILFTILVLLCASAKSQFTIQTSYQVSQAWRGGTCDLGYKKNDHYFHFVYQLNKDYEPVYEDNIMFRRRFFGRNILEQSSIGLGYEYSLKLKSKCPTLPFLLYWFTRMHPFRISPFFPSLSLRMNNPHIDCTNLFFRR